MKNYLIIIACFYSSLLFSQKLSVQRCADIDRKVPITNIFIDKNNNKWVADTKGLFLAQSPEFASIIEVDDQTWSLLSVSDGNFELKLPKSDLMQIMEDNFKEITTANYNKIKKELWVGTSFGGLYQFSVGSKISLIKHHTKSNSKLRTDVIQCIQSTASGKVLVGTSDGLVIFEEKKSELVGKYFSIDAIEFYSRIIWLLSDGELYEVSGKNDLLPFDVEPRLIDGQIVDFAFDKYGQLWIASDIIARFNREEETYDIFGPAQNFTSQNVNRIAIDEDDALWVGTSDKGVYYIGESLTLTANLVVENPLSCNTNAKDATLKVRASGGQPPYSFLWNQNIKGENPQNLGPGEYKVTVTDQVGNEAISQITLEDSRIELKIDQEKAASPGGLADGKAVVVVVNSRAVFNYKWDNGEIKRRASNLTPGNHRVTVSNSEGCNSVASIEITESLAPLALNLSQTQKNNCKGDATASIEAIVKGGKGPYTYLWEGIVFDQSKLEKLNAGTYRVTVTDAENNKVSDEITIEDPKVLEAVGKTLQSANTNASDGKAKVTANGGQEPYTYFWSNGLKTGEIDNLAAGSYQVTVTDANGCMVEASVEITEDILPLEVEIIADSKLPCADAQTGSIEAKVSGGKGPFKYQWSDSSNNNSKLNNLGSGDYSVTVTDAVGTQTQSNFTLKAPNALSVFVTAKSSAKTNANDGKAQAEANGGSGKYTYLWDNNETKSIASNLSPGKHFVTVTDANGCSTIGEIEISENFLPLQVSINQTNSIQCHGDNKAAFEVEATGGKPPFNFLWSTTNIKGQSISNIGPGNYSVTVVDANNSKQTSEISIPSPPPIKVNVKVNAPAETNQSNGKASINASGGTGKFTYVWDNGETETTATKLGPGRHSITVTDENGCRAITQFDITEDIIPLNVIVEQTEAIKCKGDQTGAIALEVSGGRPPYNFTWNSNDLNGQSLKNLSAGTYKATVTDADGASESVSISIEEPGRLIIGLEKNRPATYEDSKDGRALLKIQGGSGSYQYQWDNGEDQKEARRLNVGPHSVTVTDANNCSASVTFETKKRINPEITASALQPGQKLQVSQLYFDADSTEAKPESYPALDEIADFLKENTSIKIEVGGHTNNVPPADYCDQLSTARAKSVATYIVQQGVDPDRIFYRGYGKREPKYSNRTDDGRRRNQRVEIKVLEIGSGG